MIRKIFALALIGVLAAVQAQDADHDAGQVQPTPATEATEAEQPDAKLPEDEVERLPTASIDIEGYSENGVIVLTEDNFTGLLEKHYPMLVIQYSKSQCKDCTLMFKDFTKAAQRLIKLDPPSFIGSVDTDAYPSFKDESEEQSGKSLSIQFYEKHYKGPEKYEAGITQSEVYQWMLDKQTASGSQLMSAELLKEEAGKVKRALIYVGPEDAPHFQLFMALSKQEEMRQLYVFFHCFDWPNVTLGEDLGIKVPAIMMAKNYDRPLLAFNKQWKLAELEEWANKYIRSSVVNFDSDIVQPLFTQLKQGVILFTNDEEAPHISAFRAAAEERSNSMLFVMCRTDDQIPIQQRLAHFVGLENMPGPYIRIIYMKAEDHMDRFEPAVQSVNDITSEQIVEFVDSYMAKEIEPMPLEFYPEYEADYTEEQKQQLKEHQAKLEAEKYGEREQGQGQDQQSKTHEEL